MAFKIRIWQTTAYSVLHPATFPCYPRSAGLVRSLQGLGGGNTVIFIVSKKRKERKTLDQGTWGRCIESFLSAINIVVGQKGYPATDYRWETGAAGALSDASKYTPVVLRCKESLSVAHLRQMVLCVGAKTLLSWHRSGSHHVRVVIVTLHHHGGT